MRIVCVVPSVKVMVWVVSAYGFSWAKVLEVDTADVAPVRLTMLYVNPAETPKFLPPLITDVPAVRVEPACPHFQSRVHVIIDEPSSNA